jgi:hypothetical protein
MDQTRDERSSLGILPAETLANFTMATNETFSNEHTFGLGLHKSSNGATPQADATATATSNPGIIVGRPLPLPPSPDLAEQQALDEFNRLKRMSKSPVTQMVETVDNDIGRTRTISASKFDENAGTAFASVNNSAETVIQRKLSEHSVQR